MKLDKIENINRGYGSGYAWIRMFFGHLIWIRICSNHTDAYQETKKAQCKA